MKTQVLTDHPVAFHSPDHIQAEHSGSGNDNSINPNFNAKLYQLYPGQKLSVLDLGCAGGGFVKSLIDDGHFAIGLEGSDYSKLRKRAEWATIPDHLFTADVTKPYAVMLTGDSPTDAMQPIKFDIVTCWEVMEHFSEAELPGVIENVKNHLKEDGLWIMSVSTQSDGDNFHRCVRTRHWWLEMFAKNGWHHQEKELKHFGRDMVRGPHPTPWAITANDSFHLIMKRS